MTEQTTLQALTRRRIVLIAAYAVTVAAYAAAILLILVDLRYAVAVVNVATLFYLLVVRRMDKRYELAFANASMRYGCGHCLQDVAVKTKARDALSHAQVEQMSLLPTREAGGVASSMEMTGRLDGRSVKVCEAAFCYDLPAGSRQKIGLKNGVWMELELPGTAAHTVLVPETALDDAVCAEYYEGKGLHSFAKAPRGWAVFTENDLDAARLLRKSESLRQKLETSQSSMILAVKGSRLAAYSFPRSLSFTTPLLGQLTQEILEWDRLPELGWLAELSAMLGRHTAKNGQTVTLNASPVSDAI